MSTEYYKPPEKEDDGLTPEQREMAEYFLPQFAEDVIPEKERRDCNQEVVELQTMFVAFEAKYPISELYAITNLRVEDAPNNLMREAAKEDLVPIVARLSILKKETNIASGRYEELDQHYTYLSKAVGMINGDKVRH